MTYLQSEIWNEAKAFVMTSEPSNNKEFGDKLRAMIDFLTQIQDLRNEAYSQVKKK